MYLIAQFCVIVTVIQHFITKKGSDYRCACPDAIQIMKVGQFVIQMAWIS